MITVNVAQLLQSPPGDTRAFAFSDRIEDVGDELELAGPVVGHANLVRTSRGIVVHASFSAPVRMECARCLDEVRVQVEGELDAECRPSVDVRTGVPIPDETREADEPECIDDHHELVLDELLRQTILTELPLAPLCEENCPGICPTCGQRLGPPHAEHADEPVVEDAPPDTHRPFAHLAELLRPQSDASAGDDR